MGAIASQITSLTIVYSNVYSDADQRNHQSSASLAFVRGIHRRPVNSPHKWPVTRKMFPFDDVIILHQHWFRVLKYNCVNINLWYIITHSFLCFVVVSFRSVLSISFWITLLMMAPVPGERPWRMWVNMASQQTYDNHNKGNRNNFRICYVPKVYMLELHRWRS